MSPISSRISEYLAYLFGVKQRLIYSIDWLETGQIGASLPQRYPRIANTNSDIQS